MWRRWGVWHHLELRGDGGFVPAGGDWRVVRLFWMDCGGVYFLSLMTLALVVGVRVFARRERRAESVAS